MRHFPERSWTVETSPCLTVVKSFTNWCALLLLFFLRFSSISLHCSPSRFSFAFSMHLSMFLFTSLYFSDPSGSKHFFLSSLLLSDRSRISVVTQGFFLLTMFAKDLAGCFSHCYVEVGDHRVHVCIFIIYDVRGANFPPVIAWKVSNTLASFSFSMSNLNLVCFGLLILFIRRWKVIINKSWSLPMSAPGKLRVLAITLSLESNQFGCGVVHLSYARSIFWMLWNDQ